MKTLILVAIRYSLMFTAVTASLFSVRPAQAGYIVTLQQVGPGSPDVIATGSGSIDLTGLTIVSRRTPTETDIEPANGGIFTGPNAFCDVYEGNLSGPTSFGIGSATFTNSGSGDMVGIDKALNLLAVPTGYVSGTPLSNMATWSGKTLATLGVTPGTYVWTWGAGANQNFTLVIPGAGPISTLENISSRAFVQTGDNVMIGGFIVQGTQPKRVIIRAIGPELTQHGVPNALGNPTLELHNSSGALIASNDDWQRTIIGGVITSDQVLDIRNSGHAPTDGRESAIIAELPPGNYTAIVRGVNNTIGVGLVEVYALSSGSNSILGNLSTRSFVQTGDNVMIGGFIVQGTKSKRVIIRAIGPELTQHGVPDALGNPTLELHDSSGALIASNDDWQHTIIGGIITSDQVREIIATRLAPRDARESAIVAELNAGNYTAIVRGVNDTTGVALVEVYDLDQ